MFAARNVAITFPLNFTTTAATQKHELISKHHTIYLRGEKLLRCTSAPFIFQGFLCKEKRINVKLRFLIKILQELECCEHLVHCSALATKAIQTDLTKRLGL